MKKKCLPLVFTALCLILCMIPSVGMIFRPTTEPIGNERAVELPSLTDGDGALNLEYFTQLGAYFNQHFAFRSEALTADAKLMSGVFGTSNVDSVTVGSDGWLYYTDTLDDYLGRDVFTSREVRDVIRNLSLIRGYTESQGAQFLFTIAPNKNTLYPEHMPYYDSLQVSETRNRDLIRAALADSDIPYADLFALFEEQDEVLYFARDSHWNNKGALLAYDGILTALGKEHDDYADAPVTRRKDFIGDLSRMIYPAGAEPEYEWYYGAEDRYTYVTPTKSVEDGRITTACGGADGRLYMYRDSFGNALLPFFAAAYGDATFTKAFPMILSADLAAARPDTFIMELVERNLDWLITRPPILPSPRLTDVNIGSRQEADLSAEAQPCMYSKDYVQFGGEVDSAALADDDALYAAVTDAAGETVIYACYGLRGSEGRTGFIAYAAAADYPAGSELKITVIKQSGGEFIGLGSAAVTIGGK